MSRGSIYISLWQVVWVTAVLWASIILGIALGWTYVAFRSGWL